MNIQRVISMGCKAVGVDWQQVVVMVGPLACQHQGACSVVQHVWVLPTSCARAASSRQLLAMVYMCWVPWLQQHSHVCNLSVCSDGLWCFCSGEWCAHAHVQRSGSFQHVGVACSNRRRSVQLYCLHTPLPT
jgi:hypothetical protein